MALPKISIISHPSINADLAIAPNPPPLIPFKQIAWPRDLFFTSVSEFQFYPPISFHPSRFKVSSFSPMNLQSFMAILNSGLFLVSMFKHNPITSILNVLTILRKTLKTKRIVRKKIRKILSLNSRWIVQSWNTQFLVIQLIVRIIF